MTTIETDWRREVVWICGPVKETDTRESWFQRGAKRAGVKWRQIKALFHGEVTDPKYSVGAKVRSAAEQARREAQQELVRLAAKYQNIAGGLNEIDSDFHSTQVAALLEQAGRFSNLAGTGDSK